MTVEGLIFFNQKEFELSSDTENSCDKIVWNDGILKVTGQNRINYKYHLLVKTGKNLQTLSNPSSIDSTDWEGFFLPDKAANLNSNPEGIAVTYSTDEKICTITRDTFGLVPVYYFHLPDRYLAFSTSLPSLLQMEGVLDNLTVNPRRITQYLAFRLDSLVDYQTETFFEQIHSILPGHQIVVTGSEIRSKRCINFNPGQWSHLKTLPEFASVFRSLFANSVEKAVAGDVIGSHLSGGLDSSSISAFAKKLYPSIELHSFHAAPNTRFASENEYAQAVADKIGSTHHEVSPQHNDFELLTKYTAIYGHPEVMVLSPALQGSLMEAAHCKGCTTLLIGHDGDSVVGSGFDHLIALFNQRKWTELKEFLDPRINNPSFLRLFKNWDDLNENQKLQAVYHDFFGRRFQEVAGKFTIKGLFTLFIDVKKNFNISILHFIKRGVSSIIRKLLDKPIPNSLVRDAVRISGMEKAKAAEPLSKLLNENLEKKYEYSFSSVYNSQSITLNEEFFALGNYYSLKTSLPFYDKELLELCMAVPSKLKLGDGIGRQHFREAMEGILPEKVRTRRDKAVFSSYGRLAAIRIFAEAAGLLQNDRNEVWNFVDKAKFDKIVKILHNDSQTSLDYGICQFHVLRTVSLAVWFDWLSSLKSIHQNKKRL